MCVQLSPKPKGRVFRKWLQGLDLDLVTPDKEPGFSENTFSTGSEIQASPPVA